jgi:alcohol dehydrogenase class IV
MQKEYFGINSIRNLTNILKENKTKNIFLITGKKSYELSGAKEAIDNLLRNYNVTRFSEFDINPKIKDVEMGIELFKEKNYDVVIAVGGGSVIDMAKLINILSRQKKNAKKYIKKENKIKNKGSFLIAIPTTAGSGSESTHFAVVYIDKVKYSLANKLILPDVSIVDPNLMLSVPKKIAASCGIDALSQSIESYWCINSTEESKKYSIESIGLIKKNIVKAINKLSRESTYALAKAAHLSGKAINITKTTAPHAVSYPFTSYFGIPHGHAVGLTLGKFLIYNSKVTKKDVIDKRGEDYVKKTIKELNSLLGCKDSKCSNKKIEEIMHKIKLETNLKKLGII